MSKLWKGRTSAKTSVLADEFNSSIKIDKRMYKEDIEGSMAHVAMLSHCNIILKSLVNSKLMTKQKTYICL